MPMILFLLLVGFNVFAGFKEPSTGQSPPPVGYIAAEGEKGYSPGRIAPEAEKDNDNYHAILSWNPRDSKGNAVPVISFSKLKEFSDNAILKSPSQGDHRYAPYYPRDGCFHRNMLSKIEFGREEGNPNSSPASASIIIKTVDKYRTTDGSLHEWGWSYHTASVWYTDQGAIVFDPDNMWVKKDGHLIFDKTRSPLVPLNTWIGNWKRKGLSVFLAPAGIVFPPDNKNKTENPTNIAFKKFYDSLDNTTPDNPYWKTFPNNQQISCQTRDDSEWLLDGNRIPARSKSIKNYQDRRDAGLN